MDKGYAETFIHERADQPKGGSSKTSLILVSVLLTEVPHSVYFALSPPEFGTVASSFWTLRILYK